MEYSVSKEREFDNRRDEFGLNAGFVLDYLCDPAFNDVEAGLCEDDFQALDDLHELEERSTGLFDPLVARDDKYELVDHLEQLWHDFRASLPFSEAERRWFLNVDADLRTDEAEATWTEKLGRQEATIVSAGLHKTISGRELLRRWFAWRRETNEFEGQGTLDMAREALRELIELVTPDEPLPESYLALRRSSSA